jgi:ribosomal protein S12 methylthiotransferase accessory factor YcaO
MRDQLRTDLAAKLRALAERIERDQLRAWQLERLAAALSPELAVLAKIDGVRDVA